MNTEDLSIEIPPCLTSLLTRAGAFNFVVPWLSVMKIISGGMDSARLMRNQKPYNNRVKWKGFPANRKTSLESGLLSLLDKRRGESVSQGIFVGGRIVQRRLLLHIKRLQSQPVNIIKNTIYKASLYCHWHNLICSLTQKLKLNISNSFHACEHVEENTGPRWRGERRQLAGCSSFAPPFNACSCTFAHCVKHESGALQ